MNLSESYKKRLSELAGTKNLFGINVDGLLAIAKGNDYNTFLNKTDALTSKYNILYRGMQTGDALENDSFMTDYIGHARQYSDDGWVDGILYNNNDILLFSDNVFNKLRAQFKNLKKQDISKIHSQYIKADNYPEDIKFVFDFLRSDMPYSKMQQNFEKNNLLIPIMMQYTLSQNKNILSFLGSDYSDFGGADEFVVHDISKYPTLHNIWESVN